MAESCESPLFSLSIDDQGSPSSKFPLFGYPILHSASPAFQNAIFSKSGKQKLYSLYSTTKVTPYVLESIRNDQCGGAGVTMPIKVAMIPYLDDLTEEGRLTGAVNTIVKVKDAISGNTKLVGTNTDILGVKNALLRYLRFQYPEVSITPHMEYDPSLRGAAVIFGGGGTTRSAAHALHSLGLHPIYLVNRDVEEVKAVQTALPHVTSKGSLIHLDHPDKVEALLAQPGSPMVLMIVGAIPAITPVTPQERMVYTTASHIFTLPYNIPTNIPPNSLPPPRKRLFLEMPYKPRNTPLMQVATAHGWEAICGIEAMIEQGFAQQRMWARGDPGVTVGSDPTILGPEVEEYARDLANNMKDVIVKGEEKDNAEGVDAAVLRS